MFQMFAVEKRDDVTPEGGSLFRYVTNHPGRLSLLPFVGR